MIAKIGGSGNLHGALAYNQLKVENENGKILFANKMIVRQWCVEMMQVVFTE
jgi:hypothetical protein